MMASLVLFDLDLELDLASVYQNAKDTIEYLEDLIKSIDNRVLGGEEIAGLRVVQKSGNRYITPPGEKYLASVLGEDKFYKTIKKPLTLTELSNELTPSEIDMLEKEGYISRKEGSRKVEVIQK
jgi:hypothetical protein